MKRIVFFLMFVLSVHFVFADAHLRAIAGERRAAHAAESQLGSAPLEAPEPAPLEDSPREALRQCGIFFADIGKVIIALPCILPCIAVMCIPLAAYALAESNAHSRGLDTNGEPLRGNSR